MMGVGGSGCSKVRLGRRHYQYCKQQGVFQKMYSQPQGKSTPKTLRGKGSDHKEDRSNIKIILKPGEIPNSQFCTLLNFSEYVLQNYSVVKK